MKNKTKSMIMLAIVLTSTSSTLAQFTRNFSVDVGLSNPSGRFAQINSNDSLSGFATSGSHFAVGIEQFNAKGLGLYAHYTTNGIGYNVDEAERQLNNVGKPNGYEVVEYTVKRYNVSSMNFGGIYAVTDYKFNIYAKLGLGFSSCRSADLNYTLSDGINTINVRSRSDTKYVGNINTNIQLSYNLSRRLELYVAYGYQYQKPIFNNSIETYINGSFSDFEEVKNAQPMSFYNFAIGLKINIHLPE
jgi:hypothetical protein